MEHETSIMTNDGWTISLVSDKPIDLTGITLRTIIVQPRKEYDTRMEQEKGLRTVTEYKLKRS